MRCALLNNLISDKLFSTLTILTFTQRNEFPAKTRCLPLSDFFLYYYQMLTWNLKLLVHGLISGKLLLFNIWSEAANEKLDQFSIDHDQSRDSQNQKLLIFFFSIYVPAKTELTPKTESLAPSCIAVKRHF